ncbi:uncharacterized protein LOC111798152 [Cucurbita pepo subsp. pepo]|uniref:uncharacterized protein LOC111798152 n=1 Tax=Cucurbita pepo subsp. pepo TaxID=3664 RepID=UPI000C9DA566|nr:uncharacterized protein LOC111798152 [Cucurbita pepo subsp. pepo]
MDSKTFHRPLLLVLVFSLLVVSSFCLPDKKIYPNNHTAAFRSENQLKKLKLIQADLNRINKFPVKTIQSPDGDFIDCVETHRQLAFDHPLLKGKKPLDPPERPYNQSHSGEVETEMFQLWSMSGEFCPEGTVPIRRTTEEDMLRASSVQRFGRKASGDSPSKGHEYAVGFVGGGQYYGAQASMTVWKPRVNYRFEFSLSQIWLKELQWLCHDIDELILGGNESNIKLTSRYSFTNEVIINLNMLRPSMKDWIGGQVGGTNVVTPQARRSRLRDPELTQENLDPN